ncbi:MULTISPECIES: hypothetical protein [Citrobacter]|uniref:hypothetical protein n=1 Tax=Citrobacter TaxID=544 RepID=UPI001093D131|nr:MULTISPECIES: hypothetical protein [Citrobacter]MBD0826561.1 hypothetical protein [Citrobacter sp. C1]
MMVALGNYYNLLAIKLDITRLKDVQTASKPLIPEVEPFGHHSMLVEPGFSVLNCCADSTTYAASSINNYAKLTNESAKVCSGMDGQQGGAAKHATAIIANGLRKIRNYSDGCCSSSS